MDGENKTKLTFRANSTWQRTCCNNPIVGDDAQKHQSLRLAHLQGMEETMYSWKSIEISTKVRAGNG